MKRITLEIDLKENEAFEKEIEKIIRAKARELARNEHARLIEDEIRHEIQRLTNANSWGYKDKLKSIIRGLVNDELKKTVSDMDIEKLAKERVNDKIEYIVSNVTADVREKCKTVLEEIVIEEVRTKLKAICSETN